MPKFMVVNWGKWLRYIMFYNKDHTDEMTGMSTYEIEGLS